MEHVTHSLQRSEMMVAVLNSLSNGTMIAVLNGLLIFRASQMDITTMVKFMTTIATSLGSPAGGCT